MLMLMLMPCGSASTGPRYGEWTRFNVGLQLRLSGVPQQNVPPFPFQRSPGAPPATDHRERECAMGVGGIILVVPAEAQCKMRPSAGANEHARDTVFNFLVKLVRKDGNLKC
jgi:hypothetical protein